MIDLFIKQQEKSPFECVYGLQPIGPMDLAPSTKIKGFSADVEMLA